jgi:LuxR family maltose regulon positive regulatory protein
LLPADSLAYRARASYVLGTLFFSAGDFDEAWAAFTDAADLARRGGDHLMATEAIGQLAGIMDHRGKLRAAMDLCRQAIQLAGQLPIATLAYHTLAKVQYERNEIDEAIRNQETAARLFDLVGVPELRPQGYLQLATYRLAKGDTSGVNEALGKVDRVLPRSTVRPGIWWWIPLWRGILALRQDDMATALDWAKQYLPYADVQNFNGLHYGARLQMVMEGRRAVAAAQLRDLQRRAVEAHADGLAVEIGVYQVLATDDPAEALSFLSEALTQGQAEGYTRTFVDEGRLLKPMLRRLLSQGVLPEYVTRLLGIIEAEERARRNRTGGSEDRPSDLLSRREIEVLRLIDAGLSNQQIAERLVVTLATAKSHVHNIALKLSSRNRTEALARARELKLI